MKEPILFKAAKGPGNRYRADNLNDCLFPNPDLDSITNDNIMQIGPICRDIINHSKKIIKTNDFLIGWPTGFEIEPVNKRMVIDISNISVGELMNRFLPEGIPDIDKQRKIIESSEGY